MAICTSFSVLMGLAQSGQTVFDESYVHEIRVTFQDPNFWDSLDLYYNNMMNNGAPNQYLMASEVSIDGVIIDSVGVRQKGNFSNWGAFNSVKKPLKLDFKEFADHKFDGLKKLNLANGFEDPTIMRDALAYHIMRSLGLQAPRTAYAKVYLNNQYWGLYVMIEQVDSEFLEDNFQNPDGNLYKCIDNTSLNNYGTNWNNYTSEFELKTNELINDNSRFVDFIQKIHLTSAADFNDSLDQVLETSDFLAVLACDILMYNWDSYYDHGRNFYVYLNPDNNKFDWIPWDYNLAFSSTTTDIIVDYAVTSAQPKQLVRRMQLDPEFRDLYFAQICYILLTKFNLTELESYIDQTAALIRPAYLADPNKFFSINNFDTNISNPISVGWGGFYPGLKSFISGRMTTVMGQLSNYGYSCVLSVDDESEENWKIYPNPIHESLLTIDFVGSEANIPFSISTISGEVVKSGETHNGKAIVDFSDLSNGMYIVKAVLGNKVLTQKVVKE